MRRRRIGDSVGHLPFPFQRPVGAGSPDRSPAAPRAGSPVGAERAAVPPHRPRSAPPGARLVEVPGARLLREGPPSRGRQGPRTRDGRRRRLPVPARSPGDRVRSGGRARRGSGVRFLSPGARPRGQGRPPSRSRPASRGRPRPRGRWVDRGNGQPRGDLCGLTGDGGAALRRPGRWLFSSLLPGPQAAAPVPLQAGRCGADVAVRRTEPGPEGGGRRDRATPPCPREPHPLCPDLLVGRRRARCSGRASSPWVPPGSWDCSPCSHSMCPGACAPGRRRAPCLDHDPVGA